MWNAPVNPLALEGKEQLLRALAARGVVPSGRSRGRHLKTGLAGLDELAPGGALQGGAVDEVLWRKSSPCPTTFALLLARAAQTTGGAVAWSDPDRELYLP